MQRVQASWVSGFAPLLTEARATLRLAAPIALAQLSFIAMNTTDVILLAWLGSESLAAASLGMNLYFIMFVSALGIAIAVAPMAAQARGRGDDDAMADALHQGLWASTLVAAPLAGSLWFGGDFLRFIGEDAAISAQSEIFLRALLWGLAPAMWFTVLRSFIAVLDRVNVVLAIGMFGVLFNAIFNYGLIFGHFGLPALGIIGSGIASSTVNAVMFVLLAAYVLLHPRLRRLGLWHGLARFKPRRLIELFRLGLPISGAFMLEVGLFSAAGLLMGYVGTAALAAHQIALQVAGTTFMVPLGISQAATIRVGYHIGAGDHPAAGRAGWLAFALGAGFMSTMAVTIWIVPRSIVRLFLDESLPGNETVAAIAVTFLAVAALFQVFDGTQTIGTGVLRGLKDTQVPMLLAAIGYWGVGFPLAAALGFGFDLGGIGVWIGLAASLATVAGLMLWRWSRRGRLLSKASSAG
ncbi:MAG: MATE family efflux transporter [Proteobacteria bacterium]|nr:MATE family efflux transporter [Pseudomonadota bacterium]MBI3498090.1 MATE family efflux transporter [Pseudomonadota bacterium]